MQADGLRLGPLGTIGSALPNSLAVQLANPGKPVVLITGDGSLGFYIAEMDTAVAAWAPGGYDRRQRRWLGDSSANCKAPHPARRWPVNCAETHTTRL